MFRNILRAGALALGLIGAALAATPANAAPNDAGLAAKIDTFLQQQGSPLAGLGSVFVKNGIAHNLDPRLLVAIAGQESNYGKTWSNCPESSKNAWSLFLNGQPCSNTSFATYTEGVQKVTRQLAKIRETYQKFGSIAAIGSRYCPPGEAGCAAWATGVTSIYVQLGGNTADLSYKGTAVRIDFENRTSAPAVVAPDPKFTIGVASFEGGQVVDSAPHGPIRSKAYGLTNACATCPFAMQITFSQPVSNVRFSLISDLGFSGISIFHAAITTRGTRRDRYTGINQSFFLDEEGVVGFTIYSYGQVAPIWNFYIDNLEFTID